ncbi:MAG: hypothetical protein AAB673_02255, partial [Patescibacteria group bacterium]
MSPRKKVNPVPVSIQAQGPVTPLPEIKLEQAILSVNPPEAVAGPKQAKPRRRRAVAAKKAVKPAAVNKEIAVRDQTESGAEEYFSPTPHFYRTIALGFVAVSVVVIFLVLYLTGNRATIDLTLKERTVKADSLVNLVPKLEEGATDQIEGWVLELSVKGEKKFAVSEGKESPVAATGQVTIYNKTARDQKLVATTRLLSGDTLFRLKRGVTAPAKGQVIAEVYADKPGKEGEIGPSKFVIPGLSEILQKNIYAESEAAMSGGTKFINALTDEEIKKAQEDLIGQLFAEGKLKLQALASSSKTYDGRVFTYYQPIMKTEAKAGQEISEFKLSGGLNVVGLFYKSADLNKIMLANLHSNLMDEEKIIGEPSRPSVEVSKYDLKAKTAELRVTEEAQSRVTYSKDLLDNNRLLGQKKAAAEEYLKSLSWIDRVEI